ncbi:MAG: hypothetical protein R2731_02505 [Nocardioides sp.]
MNPLDVSPDPAVSGPLVILIVVGVALLGLVIWALSRLFRR